MRTPIALTLMLTLSSCADPSEAATARLTPPDRDGWSSDSAWSGFTLVAPLDSKTVHLVDMSGTAVHSWKVGHKTGEAAYLTERGTLLKCQRGTNHPTFENTGGHGGLIEEFDRDGTRLWSFPWESEQGLSHHDIEELPNGNVLFIAWDRTTREVALAAGRDPELLEGEEFWAGAIYEVRPTRPVGGEVVWSWHAIDHVIQNRDPQLPNYAEPHDRPERIDINGDRDPAPPSEEDLEAEREEMEAMGYAGGEDEEPEDEETEDEEEAEKAAQRARVKGADWMHTNGIDYNATLDQIVISVRRFDEIWIIDHAPTTAEAAGPKGDLLYRWGNPFAYGMGEWEQRQLLGQHNVQWIPEGQLGAGNLIVFNNGARPREWSTADEWWAPRDVDGRYPREEGQPWGPTELQWRYEAETPEDFYSGFISGVERQPNGNTLICAGAPGRVFEVTPAGEIVWDWRSPYRPEPEEAEESNRDFSTAMFRAPRYAADHPAIVALRARGAAIPLNAGAGPATNQAPPPEDDESGDDE